MQKFNYMTAEAVYKKAQMIDPDANKACNLGLCLIRQCRFAEAQRVLEEVLEGGLPGGDDPKPRRRAEELLMDLRLRREAAPPQAELSYPLGLSLDDDLVKGLERLVDELAPAAPRSRRLPVFEEISPFRDQLTY